MRPPIHTLLTFSTLSTLTLVSAHGILTSPPSRIVGPAMKAACGQQVTNNLQSNAYGDIQQLARIATSQKDFTPSCTLSLCKGLQFADVPAPNIQSYQPGEVVRMTVDIQAKHTGTANVSVVDTARNAVLGQMLLVFPVYASTSVNVPKNQTAFEVVMPDVSAECSVQGRCVLQWWWDSREAGQTYMSCVDFTM